jgi:hypothetical protein
VKKLIYYRLILRKDRIKIRFGKKEWDYFEGNNGEGKETERT